MQSRGFGLTMYQTPCEQKMGVSTTASDKLAKLFEEMHKTHFPDKIDATNITEENEFEKLWDRERGQ